MHDAIIIEIVLSRYSIFFNEFIYMQGLIALDRGRFQGPLELFNSLVLSLLFTHVFISMFFL